jgi:hypothetical protein
MKRKVSEVWSNNSILRLCTTISNITILSLLCLHHLYTGTKDFEQSLKLITQLIVKEAAPPILDIRLSDGDCNEKEEKTLPLYTWPGSGHGCICLTNSRNSSLHGGYANPSAYAFLGQDCHQKGVHCEQTFAVKPIRPALLNRTNEGKTICAV